MKKKKKESASLLHKIKNSMKSKYLSLMHLICGKEESGKINLSVAWTMISTVSTIILLLITCFQLYKVNDTTSADFSNRIKADIYNQANKRLITLFENNAILFKADSSNQYIWFEIDTVLYKKLKNIDKSEVISTKFNIIEIDALIQSFEDLSFYEKRGQITIDYIYDAYAYYIEMLWENPQIKKYIQWQRNQEHFSNSYSNMENIYKNIKEITDSEK